MKIRFLPILLVIIAGITVGTAIALEEHNNPPVNINGGNLNIIDGSSIYTRTDGVQTNIVLKNDVSQTAFEFLDVDSNQKTTLRQTSNGERFDIFNFDGSTFRVDLSIKNSNGNIGLGQVNPSEKLDVNGNIHLSGVNSKITSNGDICIGSCS